MEQAAEKRKQREMKKFGKEVQRKKLEERQQAKKQQLEKVKRWREGKVDH